MITKLANAVKLAESWPEDAQETLAMIAREMDEELKSGVYHPTPDELSAIEEGIAELDAGIVATDEEVEEAFASFQRG